MNQSLRDACILQLAGWNANQPLFLSESAANERTTDRKYSSAPIRVTSHEYKSSKSSERWSILLVYTVDGFYSWIIIQGSYIQELFNELVRTKGVAMLYALSSSKVHSSYG